MCLIYHCEEKIYLPETHNKKRTITFCVSKRYFDNDKLNIPSNPKALVEN